MARRLVITNGDNAVERLSHRSVGLEADFVPWRDALHDGPVPTGLLLEALSIIRAQFLAKELSLRLPEVTRQFAERNAAVRNHGQYDRIELWFEHDLYDQLQLLELLDFFASEERIEGLVLIQADEFLTSLPAESLRALAEHARAIEPVDFEIAQRVWHAFTAATPEKLSVETASGAFRFPFLAPALRRQLQELPAINSGLSLTEEYVLNALARGSRFVKELFDDVQAQESTRFLADTFFFRRLDRLAFTPQPLIAGLEFASTAVPRDGGDRPYARFAAQRVRLTEAGREALAGRFDHAAENDIDRWVGGTHLTSKALWRRGRDGLLAKAPGTENGNASTGRFSYAGR